MMTLTIEVPDSLKQSIEILAAREGRSFFVALHDTVQSIKRTLRLIGHHRTERI